MSDLDVSLMRGTLDLLILKALSWGPQHGYSVAEWMSSWQRFVDAAGQALRATSPQVA